MKKGSILICCLLIFSISVKAQLRAVTSNGEEVILNTDGTWRYANGSPVDTDEKASKVDTNKVKFTKADDATFLVKSNRIGYGVYIDPKTWSFEKSAESESSEYDFNLKAKDAYAMLISEKIEIPMNTLKKAALTNAQAVSKDIQIVKEEYRYVNGKLLLLLQMDGTVSGIKFSYIGYYFSSPKGTMQLLTYTATNLLTEYRPFLEAFLNGFVSLEN